MFSAIQRLLVKSGHNFSVLIECSIQIFHAADNNAFKLGAIKPYSAAEFEYGGTVANSGLWAVGVWKTTLLTCSCYTMSGMSNHRSNVLQEVYFLPMYIYVHTLLNLS